MRFLLSFIATLLHVVLVFASAPLAAGILAKCRARRAGFAGAPVLQPYHDLAKLLGKTPVMPDTASPLYPLWPYLELAASGAAALLVPSFATGMLTAGNSDLLTFAGLLALARAAAWAAALETGGAAGGAAVTRGLPGGIAAAAAWACAVLALVLITHDPAIDTMVGVLRRGAGVSLPLALGFAAVLAVAMVETGGATDELRREYAGRYLLLQHYAAMLRLINWLGLLGAVVCPFGLGRAGAILSWPGGLLLWPVKLLALAAALAAIGGAVATPRPARVPGVLGVAALLGVVSALLLLITGAAP